MKWTLSSEDSTKLQAVIDVAKHLGIDCSLHDGKTEEVTEQAATTAEEQPAV